jgi:hypothetical protein
MDAAIPAAGDAIPPNCEVIQIRVGELRQLFNAIDPSPFREKDLDASAEDFIVSWARDVPKEAPLALLVHLHRPAGLPEEAAILGEAVREFFRHRADATRRRLRQLFRVGRTSLMIGISCLTMSLALGDVVAVALGAKRFGELLREGLLIGGWVAMWRPMEVFLYDWWPIRAEARLYDRLGGMPVRIAYTREAHADAWRRDWPAVSPAKGLPNLEDARNIPVPSAPPR